MMQIDTAIELIYNEYICKAYYPDIYIFLYYIMLYYLI